MNIFECLLNSSAKQRTKRAKKKSLNYNFHLEGLIVFEEKVSIII